MASVLERIASRGRSAMNFLLLTALLVSWIASRKTPDVLSSAKVIALTVPWSSESTPKELSIPDGVKQYVQCQPEDYTVDRTPHLLNVRVLDFLKPLPKVEDRLADLGYIGSEPRDENDCDCDCDPNCGRSDFDVLLDAKADIHRLDSAYRDSGLKETATLRDLIAHLKRNARLRLPLIGQTTSPAVGVGAIVSAQALILLYITSVARAGMSALRRELREGAEDWVFLHPGLLGIILGILWLITPVLAMTGVLFLGRVQIPSVAALPMLFVLLASTYFSIRTIVRFRRLYYENDSQRSVDKNDLTP